MQRRAAGGTVVFACEYAPLWEPSMSRLPSACLALLVVAVAACKPSSDASHENTAAASAASAFVGGQACATCHAEQTRAWHGSHHQQAMQPATTDTVLGDFADAQFGHGGVTTKFFTRDGAYWINTDDADGRPRDFKVRFTFGVDPLQQYILELDGGRYQAFTIAWDTRPATRGGQRWSHLYPDTAGHDDPLHWTGVYNNWNSTCAACHATNLAKNHDFANGTFATAWTSDNVDCEACHGPGSNHVAAPTTSRLPLAHGARTWAFDGAAAIARRSPAPAPATADAAEVEVCAQCHSRRTQFSDSHFGNPLLDAFRPALLNAGLYQADGQILDEVYEYGSFLQSRMQAAGVTCSDCHDPHSARLRADGNAICAQCHQPSVFDTAEHHRHAAGTRGSACVDCHMGDRTYMVVDQRRDHGFRVPRPDLSVKLGTSNACNGCHDDRSAQWAADTVAKWFPKGRSGTFHYAEALHAGRLWTADRKPLLTRIIGDRDVPAIVRATAVSLFAEQFDDEAIDIVRRGVRDDSPLVQLAAVEALANAPLNYRTELAQRFLTDAPAALRAAAARVLVPARAELGERRRNDFDSALAEYVAAQRFNSDRAEGLLNLGNLATEQSRLDEAEASYRLALQRQPEFSAAYVNLADLYRQLGRETEAEQLLRAGLDRNPTDPGLVHALGLLLARSGRLDAALGMLRRATELNPNDPRYRYVYGVALHSSGQREAGLEVLRATYERFPGFTPTLIALATMYRDAGDRDRAKDFTHRLLAISPADAGARALLSELDSAR
jgi:predicted CXXCH cytochrome family protein